MGERGSRECDKSGRRRRRVGPAPTTRRPIEAHIRPIHHNLVDRQHTQTRPPISTPRRPAPITSHVPPRMTPVTHEARTSANARDNSPGRGAASALLLLLLSLLLPLLLPLLPAALPLLPLPPLLGAAAPAAPAAIPAGAIPGISSLARWKKRRCLFSSFDIRGTRDKPADTHTEIGRITARTTQGRPAGRAKRPTPCAGRVPCVSIGVGYARTRYYSRILFAQQMFACCVLHSFGKLERVQLDPGKITASLR